jgi:hypothetical protein
MALSNPPVSFLLVVSMCTVKSPAAILVAVSTASLLLRVDTEMQAVKEMTADNIINTPKPIHNFVFIFMSFVIHYLLLMIPIVSYIAQIDSAACCLQPNTD